VGLRTNNDYFRMIFIMEMERVNCAVRTVSLNTTNYVSSLNGKELSDNVLKVRL